MATIAASPLGKAALAFVRRDRAVFPITPRAKKPPLTARGCKDASRDERVVTNWWTRWPEANIGVACGEPSGVWVLDVDEGGEATLAALEREHGPLPATVESITGSGGRHLWFAMPEAGAPDNSVRKLGEGLDTRSTGGYVVAPPSVHPSGRLYAWSVDSGDRLAPAPGWLLNLLRGPAAGEAKPPEYWAGAFAADIAEGARNNTLTSLAGYLLHRRRGIDPYLVLGLLNLWNRAHCHPPLPDAEVLQVVNSISRAEARRKGGGRG